MQGLFQHFLVFVYAVASHAVTLAAGCIVTVIIAILEKHVLKRPISVKAEISILLTFVFFACFQAWRDQWLIATRQTTAPPVQVIVQQPPAPPPRAYVSFENISFPVYTEGQPLLARFPFMSTTNIPAQHVFPVVHLFIVAVQPSKEVVDGYFKKHEDSFDIATMAEGITLILSPAAMTNPAFKDALGPVLDKPLITAFQTGKKAVLLIGSLFYSDEAGRHRLDVCKWTTPASPPTQSVPVQSQSLAVSCNGHNSIAF